MRFLDTHRLNRTRDSYAFIVTAAHTWTGHSRRMAEALMAVAGEGVTIHIVCGNRASAAVVRKWKNALNLNNVVISQLLFPQSVYRSKYVFVTHGMPQTFCTKKVDPDRVIMLWHGFAAKKHLPVWSPPPRFWVASGPWEARDLEQNAGIPIDRILPLGSVRGDYLTMAEVELPCDISAEVSELTHLIASKRCVLFAPTHNSYLENPYLVLEDAKRLSEIFKNFQTHFAVRIHPNLLHVVSDQIDLHHDLFSNLSSNYWPNTESVLRKTDLLITDYSSIWADYLLLSRPMISVLGSGAVIPSDFSFGELFPGMRFDSVAEFGMWARQFQDIESLMNHITLGSREKSEATKKTVFGDEIPCSTSEHIARFLVRQN